MIPPVIKVTSADPGIIITFAAAENNNAAFEKNLLCVEWQRSPAQLRPPFSEKWPEKKPKMKADLLKSYLKVYRLSRKRTTLGAAIGAYAPSQRQGTVQAYEPPEAADGYFYAATVVEIHAPIRQLNPIWKRRFNTPSPNPFGRQPASCAVKREIF